MTATLDPALGDAITQIAPQVLSLLAGVVAGAGGTGIALATFVDRRKHQHSKEASYIAHWLAINACVLMLGAFLFILTQVAFVGTGFLHETKELVSGLINALTIALIAAVLGASGAAITAFAGYRSQHKKVQRNQVIG